MYVSICKEYWEIYPIQDIYFILLQLSQDFFEREPFGLSPCVRNYFLRDLYQSIYYVDNFENDKV